MPFSTFDNLPEEKREKILACALDEFAQHDYDSASISKIVARAGIAKGSLYQYFADKRDLYIYLLELATQKKAELMASIRMPESTPGVFSTLRGLFHGMAAFELRYPLLAKVGYRAVHGKSPLPAEVLSKARQSTQQYFIALIEEGKIQGEIRADVDSSTAAFILTAALEELGNLITAKTRDEFSASGSGGLSETLAPEVEKTYNHILAILQDGIIQR
jgi:AcrR family transcriptional regulator